MEDRAVPSKAALSARTQGAQMIPFRIGRWQTAHAIIT
jgi:hypothetical protein